jgi:plastocyanin
VGAGRSAIVPTIVILVVLTMTVSVEIPYIPGVLASSCNLEIASPVLKSPSSGGLAEAATGSQFVISTIMSNNCVEDDVPFFALVEVRNSDGTTESLSWQSGVLKGLGYQTEVGVSWVPLRGGDYELRTFAVSNMEKPQILTVVMNQNITIATNSDKAVIAIPYDPDPSIQQANFEPSMRKVIVGVNNTVRWINGDTVSHRLTGDSENPVGFERPVFVYPGYSFEHTFTEAGQFGYADSDREWMRGIVWVIPREATSAHLELDISGLRDVYQLGRDPVELTVDISGFETGCGEFGMSVERINQLPDEQPFSYYYGGVFDCFDVAAPYNDVSYHFPFPEHGPVYEIPINQTGTYRATVYFEADYTSFHYSLTREFLVVE